MKKPEIDQNLGRSEAGTRILILLLFLTACLGLLAGWYFITGAIRV